MTLAVLDHRRAPWFLLAEDDALFLDCHCHHSAFGYSVLIELDAEERARHEADGAAYLDELADARPGEGPRERGRRRLTALAGVAPSGEHRVDVHAGWGVEDRAGAR